MRETPGVVIKSKFKVPGTKKKSHRYTTYLDYINRSDAKDSREQFETYHYYMEDEMKSSGLFTCERRSYGDTEKAELYRTTKRQDLYTRMGNVILSEMRDLSKKQAPFKKSETPIYRVRRAFKQQKLFNESLYRIERHMNDEFEHLKNQRAFEQLEQDIEYGK